MLARNEPGRADSGNGRNASLQIPRKTPGYQQNRQVRRKPCLAFSIDVSLIATGRYDVFETDTVKLLIRWVVDVVDIELVDRNHQPPTVFHPKRKHLS